MKLLLTKQKESWQANIYYNVTGITLPYAFYQNKPNHNNYCTMLSTFFFILSYFLAG